MASFRYIALDPSGRRVKGFVEAESPRLARQALKDKTLTPVEIQTSLNRGHPAARHASHRLRSSELTLTTRQLATLLQAGLPLEESLQLCGEQSENRRTTQVMHDVRALIREGFGFADSLTRFPKAFPPLYVATVSAGEKSGHLTEILLKLADYTESQQTFRQKVQLAMLYPVILITLSVVIVSGLMIYVVPDIIEVIQTSGQSLPLLTQMMVSLSNFLAHFWLWLLLTFGLLFAGIRLTLRRNALRMRLHRWFLQTPMIKKFSQQVNAARYAGTLAVLTGSGLPLVDSMDTAAAVVNNLAIRQKLQIATGQVREGISLHKALRMTGAFPPMMLHLIGSGEASGQLQSLLHKAAQLQENELQRIVTVAIGLLEPLTLVVMGGIVLCIVLAVLMPILNLNQLVG